VGDDLFGKVFLDDLRRNRVTARVAVDATENAGAVFVLVFPNGERFFIDDRGANANLRYEDIDMNLVRKSEYLYFLGYSFQDDEVIGSIARVLKEVSQDTTVVFNPGAPNLAREFRQPFTEAIREHVNILILSEAEATNLTQYDSEREILASLLSLADIVALTKGERGSIVARQDEVHAVKASRVVVLDTTGAGDAYAAGFIYGLSRNRDLRAAGEFASGIAADVVTHFGARG